jgi:hypothetical protein
MTMCQSSEFLERNVCHRREADDRSVVAVHDIDEDSIEAWTDPTSRTLWLRDLLPENLRNYRALIWSYKADHFTAPGVRSTQSILNHANNLVADLYADRQLESAFDRPIIFVCHGFGGLLVKRALAFSSSRESIALEHLRSIYTCTYGILFLGTPHNGVNKESLLSGSTSPSHFMLSLLKGSEMLNEINDQFAPLMKQFAIFNFWEELETQFGSRSYYVVDQESAAPAWDNVEKCGIAAAHSTMTKFENRKDRRFRPILEALSRYARTAPALVKTRLSKDKELMNQKRQHAIGELTRDQDHRNSQTEPNSQDYNEWCLIPRKSSTYFTGRQKHAKLVREKLGPVQKRFDHGRSKVLVVYGLGGSGKTQFCLKYVEDNKHKYALSGTSSQRTRYSNSSRIDIGVFSGSMPVARKMSKMVTHSLVLKLGRVQQRPQPFTGYRNAKYLGSWFWTMQMILTSTYLRIFRVMAMATS